MCESAIKTRLCTLRVIKFTRTHCAYLSVREYQRKIIPRMGWDRRRCNTWDRDFQISGVLIQKGFRKNLFTDVRGEINVYLKNQFFFSLKVSRVFRLRRTDVGQRNPNSGILHRLFSTHSWSHWTTSTSLAKRRFWRRLESQWSLNPYIPFIQTAILVPLRSLRNSILALKLPTADRDENFIPTSRLLGYFNVCVFSPHFIAHFSFFFFFKYDHSEEKKIFILSNSKRSTRCSEFPKLPRPFFGIFMTKRSYDKIPFSLDKGIYREARNLFLSVDV